MKPAKRRAVSELYASMLMIGVTLSFGSYIVAASVNQFDLESGTASQAAASQQASSGRLVALVYGTATPGSGGCTATYRGADGGTYLEGRAYTLALLGYGSSPFSPYEVFDNGTLLSVGGYPPISGPTPVSITLTLVSCAHPAGQTFLLVDASGDEVQIET